MLDIKYIKEKPEEVIARLAKKGKDAKEDIEAILRLDNERRALISETEALKAEQNKTNKLIPQYKKEGKDLAPVFAEMKELGAKINMVFGFKVKFTGLAVVAKRLVILFSTRRKVKIGQVGKTKHKGGQLRFNLFQLFVVSLCLST